MPSKLGYSIRDHSEEYSRFELNIPDLDETNIVANELLITAVRTAIAALTMGEIAEETVLLRKSVVSTATPSDAAAQRELGLRLFYRDLDSPAGAGKKFHVTIGCPDVDNIAQQGTNEVDITGVAVVSAIVTALEALIVSPYGGSVQFYKGLIVGRNN